MNNIKEPAPQVGTAAPSEREAFEAYITKDRGDLSTFGSGKNLHYRNNAVNNAWEGWQARARLATPPASPERKTMHRDAANAINRLLNGSKSFADGGIAMKALDYFVGSD